MPAIWAWINKLRLAVMHRQRRSDTSERGSDNTPFTIDIRSAEDAALQRETRRRQWNVLKAGWDGQPPERITRKTLEAALRRRGYKRKIEMSEAVFYRKEQDRQFSFVPTLKTIPEAEGVAPLQRLTLGAGVASLSFLETLTKLDGPYGYASLVGVKAELRERFLITPTQLEALLDDAEDGMRTADLTVKITELATSDPSWSLAAGHWHLAALVELGDMDKLWDYVVRRKRGDRCGFVREIKDNVIQRAFELVEA